MLEKLFHINFCFFWKALVCNLLIASLKSRIIDDVWAMFQMMEEPSFRGCSKWRNVCGLKMSRGLFSFDFCLFLKYVFGVQVSLGKADWDWWNKPAQGCFKVFRVVTFKCLRTAVCGPLSLHLKPTIVPCAVVPMGITETRRNHYSFKWFLSSKNYFSHSCRFIDLCLFLFLSCSLFQWVLRGNHTGCVFKCSLHHLILHCLL